MPYSEIMDWFRHARQQVVTILEFAAPYNATSR
jgi:hypothetical protein